jgi:integrase
MKLTQIIVNGLLLPTGKTDAIYFDDDCPGLGLRLRAGGKRSWVYQFQIGQKQRRMSIGTAPTTTLGVARKTASELHARVRLGEDPATAKQTKQRQAADTVEAMLRRYLPEKKSAVSLRTKREVERHLLTYAKPLHGLGVASITRRDISRLSTDLAASVGNATANVTRASLSGFFGWCVTQGLIEENPVRGSRIAETKERERVLTIPDLVAVWRACNQVTICGGAYRDIVRLLILTGLRREEIGGLRFDEIHDDRIELPPSRTKSRRAYVSPLSGPALAVLQPWVARSATVPAPGSPFVFGSHPFVSWSLGKRMLDKVLAAAGVKLESWVLHDIRRSVATGLGNELGTLPHVIEAVLNHSGHKADELFKIDTKLRQTYNKSPYEKEKRTALLAWADHVMAAIHDRAAIVVPLVASMRA